MRTKVKFNLTLTYKGEPQTAIISPLCDFFVRIMNPETSTIQWGRDGITFIIHDDKDTEEEAITNLESIYQNFKNTLATFLYGFCMAAEGNQMKWDQLLVSIKFIKQEDTTTFKNETIKFEW